MVGCCAQCFLRGSQGRLGVTAPEVTQWANHRMTWAWKQERSKKPNPAGKKRALKRGAARSQVSPLWSFKSQRGRSYFYSCCFISTYVSQRRQDIASSLKNQTRYLSPHLGIQHKWIEGQCPLTLSPGAELSVLHGPGKCRRREKTDNRDAKVWESMWAGYPQEETRHRQKCLYWERNNCWLKVSKGNMEVKRPKPWVKWALKGGISVTLEISLSSTSKQQNSSEYKVLNIYLTASLGINHQYIVTVFCECLQLLES